MKAVPAVGVEMCSRPGCAGRAARVLECRCSCGCRAGDQRSLFRFWLRFLAARWLRFLLRFAGSAYTSCSVRRANGRDDKTAHLVAGALELVRLAFAIARVWGGERGGWDAVDACASCEESRERARARGRGGWMAVGGA